MKSKTNTNKIPLKKAMIILQCLSLIIKRKIPFQEKLKIGKIIKELETVKESHDSVVSELVKELVLHDDEGAPKIKGKNYEFLNDSKKQEFIKRKTELINEPVEDIKFSIGQSVLEAAYTTDNKTKEEDLNEELGEIIPLFLDYIIV